MKNKIKSIVLETLGTINPVSFVECVVVNENPLSIRLGNDSRMILPSSVLIVAEHLTNHTRQVRVNGRTVQIYEFMDELKKGETVMVAAVQGGQSFFIMDRVKE